MALTLGVCILVLFTGNNILSREYPRGRAGPVPARRLSRGPPVTLRHPRHPSIDIDPHGPCISLHNSPVGCDYEKGKEGKGGGSSFDEDDEIFWVRRFCGRRMNTTSPCYELGGVVRCLPTLFVIGLMKAGTTALSQYVAEHPLVVPPKEKEPYFLSNYYKDMPICAWAAQFPQLAEGSRQLTFDASPNYLLQRTAARFIKELLPSARGVALLRNPVERALSQYRFAFQLSETGGKQNKLCVKSREAMRVLLTRHPFSHYVDEQVARRAMLGCEVQLDDARSSLTGHLILDRSRAMSRAAMRGFELYMDELAAGRANGTAPVHAEDAQLAHKGRLLRTVFSDAEIECFREVLTAPPSSPLHGGGTATPSELEAALNVISQSAGESLRLWRDSVLEKVPDCTVSGTGKGKGGRPLPKCGANYTGTDPPLPKLGLRWASHTGLLKACIGNTMNRDMIELGQNYWRGVQLWMSTVGRNRTLILRTEDMEADTAGVIDRVDAFFGLPPRSSPAEAGKRKKVKKLCPLDFGVAPQKGKPANLGPCEERAALQVGSNATLNGTASKPTARLNLTAAERERLQRVYQKSVSELRRVMKQHTGQDWAPWW